MVDESGWALRGFGLVVAVVGALLLYAARRSESLTETARLGVTVALTLAAADVALVFNGTAPPIYLADAAVQVAFVFWWGRALVPPDAEPITEVYAGVA